VTLIWTAGIEFDLAGYRIYRDGAATPTAMVNDRDTPVFLDFDVRPGQTYRYRISAFDFQNMESPLSEEASATVP